MPISDPEGKLPGPPPANDNPTEQAVCDAINRLPHAVLSAPWLTLHLCGYVLASPAASSDALLLLSDAVRESSVYSVAGSAQRAALEALADALAAEAPARARVPL